jgi:hypothetical protein
MTFISAQAFYFTDDAVRMGPLFPRFQGTFHPDREKV